MKEKTRSYVYIKNIKQITVALCLGILVVMIGVSYAAVPLYAMFCRVTGYGGTTQRVEQYSNRILSRKLTVRFDSNTAAGLPWEFKQGVRSIDLKIGETAKIHYTAQNISKEVTQGRATFNVTPGRAGAYFNKVECFCFIDTTLQPNERIDMPVLFYIDPEIVNVPELKNLHTITLSYTFFPLHKPNTRK